MNDSSDYVATFLEFVGVGLIILVLLLAGCGHNTGSLTLGTRVNLGLDPQNVTANISYTDGLNVLDLSRENSEWDIEVDAATGVSIDSSTGAVKGVKKIRRSIGPQITGRLVELANIDKEIAKLYIEALKNYWKYKADSVDTEQK
jgi:hypothetical protein